MNVYDFDNTIYRGESTMHLFRYYLRRHPGLVRYFPGVIRGFARYKRGKVTAQGMVEQYVPMIEAITAQVVRPGDAEKFWDAHEKNIKPFYRQQQREDDLIITASPSFTMHEICRRLGIRQLLCTEVDESQWKITFVCLRENKVKAFRERYGDCEIENFYTDSPENDQPLIDIAQHAYIVRGDEIEKIK